MIHGFAEFGSVVILRQLDRWHWFYVLHQKTEIGVWFNEKSGWQTFGSYIHERCVINALIFQITLCSYR
jgi:hypothetical protein